MNLENPRAHILALLIVARRPPSPCGQWALRPHRGKKTAITTVIAAYSTNIMRRTAKRSGQVRDEAIKSLSE